MGIITLLISISITIAIVFLGVFIWSLKSGQFDDTTTPAMRMIFDESKSRSKKTDEPPSKATTSSPDKNQSKA
ncbi:MAG: cbb3-type cytochrome oxidase assembly protein CcoS [Chryseolinea sp.]